MKKAFTLSEILVSLVVIGVVAAILIPMLNANSPQKERVMYKKAVYSMQEALSTALNDIGYSQDAANVGVDSSDSYWAGVDAAKFCNSVANAMNTIGSVNCGASGDKNSPNFVTSNGIKWWGLGGSAVTKASDKTIYVDVNGDAGPGTPGVDILKLNVKYDGRVVTPQSTTTDSTTGTNWSTENTYLGDATKSTK